MMVMSDEYYAMRQSASKQEQDEAGNVRDLGRLRAISWNSGDTYVPWTV